MFFVFFCFCSSGSLDSHFAVVIQNIGKMHSVSQIMRLDNLVGAGPEFKPLINRTGIQRGNHTAVGRRFVLHFTHSIFSRKKTTKTFFLFIQ